MGLLALAGAVSGAGNAAVQGLNTLQSGLLASQLQKERDEMETKRLAVSNQYQVARDTAGFAHSDQAATTAYNRATKTVQDERAYAARREQELYDLTHGSGGRLDTEAAAGLQRKVDNAPLAKKAAVADAETAAAGKGAGFTAEKPIRQGLRDEERQGVKDQANDPDYVAGVGTLAEAKESTLAKKQAEALTQKIEQDETIQQLRTAYVDSLEGNDKAATDLAQRRYLAATDKLFESEKADQIAAVAGMKESGLQVDRLTTALQNMERDGRQDTPQYAATKRRLDDADLTHRAFTAQVAKGAKITVDKPTSTAPVKIIDPDDRSTVPTEKKGGLMEAAQPTGPSVSKLTTGAIPVDQVPPKAEPEKPQPKPITEDMLAYAQASPDVAPGKGMMARAGDDQRHTQEMLSREGAGNTPAVAMGGDAAHTQETLKREGTPNTASATAPSSANRDLQSMLMDHEGFKGTPYKDSVGKTTVGYGFNLDDNPLTKEEAQPILERRIKMAQEQAAGRFPWFDKLDPVRKDAVTALTYNMGPTGLSSFKRFTQAMAAGDYQRAAQELDNSQWAEQVGEDRKNAMVDMIRTGRYGGAR